MSEEGKLKRIVVIVGPTGSGKTALALEMYNPAKHRIINGDSMQVYREISIGNNKEPVPDGYLFDVVSVQDTFNVVDYQRLAKEAIKEIHSQNKIPIIVGGSGMYIHSIVYDYAFQPQERLNLPDSVEYLQNLIKEQKFDLEKLNESDRQNPRRLQNILRKLNAGEDPQIANDPKPVYEIELHNLEVDLDELKQKLKKRVEEMFEQGLMQEAEMLYDLAKHGQLSPQVANAAGYKQLLAHLDGEIPEKELRERIITSHYQLAKKQLTWNRKYF